MKISSFQSLLCNGYNISFFSQKLELVKNNERDLRKTTTFIAKKNNQGKLQYQFSFFLIQSIFCCKPVIFLIFLVWKNAIFSYRCSLKIIISSFPVNSENYINKILLEDRKQNHCNVQGSRNNQGKLCNGIQGSKILSVTYL